MISWLIKIFDRFAYNRHERVKIKVYLLQEELHFRLAQGFPVEDTDKIEKKIAKLRKELNRGR